MDICIVSVYHRSVCIVFDVLFQGDSRETLKISLKGLGRRLRGKAQSSTAVSLCSSPAGLNLGKNGLSAAVHGPKRTQRGIFIVHSRQCNSRHSENLTTSRIMQPVSIVGVTGAAENGGGGVASPGKGKEPSSLRNLIGAGEFSRIGNLTPRRHRKYE